jgi:glucose dehydrogenase
VPVGGRPPTKPIIEPTKFRAYDKTTGASLWEFESPLRPMASPMTYSIQGKQYIVVAAGNGQNAELIAFSLGS